MEDLKKDSMENLIEEINDQELEGEVVGGMIVGLRGARHLYTANVTC